MGDKNPKKLEKKKKIVAKPVAGSEPDKTTKKSK